MIYTKNIFSNLYGGVRDHRDRVHDRDCVILLLPLYINFNFGNIILKQLLLVLN